nr:MAG TPA: Regulatory protein-modification, helix-turn-helix, transcriptional regulator, DNA [Caudoviricetes sp.]
MDANERLFTVIDLLREQCLITDYKTLAIDMGVHKSYISDLKSKRKKISIDFLARMKNKYRIVNLDYVVLDLGEPLLNSDTVATPQIKQHSPEESTMTYLVETIATQAEEIGSLKTKIQQLRMELQERASGNFALDAI